MVVSTCTWANGTKSTVGPFDTYFLEADAITGPFRMVSYLAQFGPESYFVNIPSSMLDDEVSHHTVVAAAAASAAAAEMTTRSLLLLLPRRCCCWYHCCC